MEMVVDDDAAVVVVDPDAAVDPVAAVWEIISDTVAPAASARCVSEAMENL